MQLDPTTTTQLLSIATGLVATVGGLAISYLTLRHEFDRTKKRVRVSMKKGLLIGVPNTDQKKTCLTVTISNVGNVSYTLATLYVAFGRYSDGVIIPNPLGTVKLPYVLASDHSCTFWTEYEDIAKHAA